MGPCRAEGAINKGVVHRRRREERNTYLTGLDLAIKHDESPCLLPHRVEPFDGCLEKSRHRLAWGMEQTAKKAEF